MGIDSGWRDMYGEGTSVSTKPSIAVVLIVTGDEEISVGVGIGSLQFFLPLFVLIALAFEDGFNVAVIVVGVLKEFGLVQRGMVRLEIGLLDMLVGVAHRYCR